MEKLLFWIKYNTFFIKNIKSHHFLVFHDLIIDVKKKRKKVSLMASRLYTGKICPNTFVMTDKSLSGMEELRFFLNVALDQPKTTSGEQWFRDISNKMSAGHPAGFWNFILN